MLNAGKMKLPHFPIAGIPRKFSVVVQFVKLHHYQIFREDH
jgi:hypothetical protein